MEPYDRIIYQSISAIITELASQVGQMRTSTAGFEKATIEATEKLVSAKRILAIATIILAFATVVLVFVIVAE